MKQTVLALGKRLKPLDILAGAALIAGIISIPLAQAAEVEQNRELSGFTRISANGPMDVRITVGEAFSVTVVADEEVQEYITTEVDGDTLMIDRERGSRRAFRGHRGQMLVTVTLPELDALRLNGSGDAWAYNISAEDFDFRQNGSGDASLSGTCGEGAFKLNGSGDLEAESLSCTNVSYDSNGSGDTELTVTGEVRIEMNGSGDLTLHGGPSIRSLRSRGSGDVEVR